MNTHYLIPSFWRQGVEVVVVIEVVGGRRAARGWGRGGGGGGGGGGGVGVGIRLGLEGGVVGV